MARDVARPAGTPPSSLLSLISGWMQQGVESFFATQRVLVDLAMRQNALAMKSFREMLSDPENSPMSILTELAVEGTSSFIEAQQILLNLAQQENEIIMTGVKDRVGGSPVALAATDLLRRTVETYVKMQQDYLKMTKKQTIQWLDALKEGKGYGGSQVVELAREGMENFVRSQKAFLDIVADEAANATGGKRMEKAKKTEMATLAREGVSAFIEAQKKLLDVAGQQMNVNLNSATKVMNTFSPARLIPMANLTGEGVRSLVDAEKAVIDTMVRSREVRPKSELKPVRSVRPTRGTRRAKARTKAKRAKATAAAA